MFSGSDRLEAGLSAYPESRSARFRATRYAFFKGTPTLAISFLIGHTHSGTEKSSHPGPHLLFYLL